MGSRPRNGRANQPDPLSDEQSLLVFGYASRIYPSDAQADFISEERHLQPWNGDGSNRIDRYDCRLLLSSIDERTQSTDEKTCPTEEMEEEMCEEERYKDMFVDIQRAAVEEEAEKQRRAEIAFDYGTGTAASSPSISIARDESSSDSEDEPFEPPIGVKLPVGLSVPENQKLNHIIERTAVFVVAKGPQMEIVIKAKQRNNADQFGFLEFDNVLNPYYKYLSKLIREKKYTPDLNKRKKKVKTDRPKSKSGTPQPGDDSAGNKPKKSSNALAAIAEQMSSSDDSDSGCELHPSLMARKRSPSPDMMEGTSAEGPRRKPASPPPERVSHIRKGYDMSKSNDMYASLFKNLAQVSNEKEEQRQREEHMKNIEQQLAAVGPQPPDEEWRSWWKSFYGTECPYQAPRPMVPPTPDLEPVVGNYAEFVAVHGASAEAGLLARPDLQLHFMHPNSPHFSYYQHRVRYIQWEMEAHKAMEQHAAASNSPRPSHDSGSETHSAYNMSVDVKTEFDTTAHPSSTPSSPSISTEGMNRRMRRRLTDSQKVSTAPPPGVFDPVSLATPTVARTVMSMAPPPPPAPIEMMSKTQSSPALLASAIVSMSVAAQAVPKPFIPSGPVSFSLAPVKEETKLVAPTTLISEPDEFLDETEDLEQSSSSTTVATATATTSETATITAASDLLAAPPVPPAIPNNSQIDRKEKARIFMEKLLNDKRRKAKEAEDLRIRELERQKAEIERQLLEAEYNKKNESKGKTEKPANTLDVIDQMINSRIQNMLKSTGLPVEEKEKSGSEGDEEESGSEDGEVKKKKRKKEKKKKHKHRHDRKRSRSRSRSRERHHHHHQEKRRRSRSRSHDRDREHRRRGDR